MSHPSPGAIAALIYARENGGRVSFIGPYGRGAYEAQKLGLVERVDGQAELNIRGQDVADDALALAKITRRKCP